MAWEIDVTIKGSGVHGLGVYANQFVPKGTRVWRVDSSMHFCTREDLLSLDRDTLNRALLAGYLHEPSGLFVWYVDGMQYVNHAPAPHNALETPEWLPLLDDHVVAVRDIQKGEEIYEDYSFWSIGQLPEGHWLRKMYMEFCPQHYQFMMSLVEDDVRRVA